MEIFYNTIEPNYKQIVRLGPRWLTEFLEMDANYQFAGWTLDLMAHFLEQLIRNQFPDYCDLDTLEDLEKCLKIQVGAEATISDRRKDVKARLYGAKKVNRSFLTSVVEAYTGAKSNIYWDGPVLVFSVLRDQDNVYTYGKLMEFLEKRLPAHIPFLVTFYESVESVAVIKAGVAASGIAMIETSEEMRNISMAYVKSGASVSSVSIIANG